MAGFFGGAHAKLRRAREHRDDFLNRSSGGLPPDWYEFKVDRARTNALLHQPDCWDLAYRPTVDIGEEYALRIGDAFQNYRAALDHMTSMICRSVEPTWKRYFPIDPRQAGRHRGAATTALLDEALPGAADLLLHSIFPDDPRASDPWAFAVMCNDDKHNELIPVVSITEIRGISADTGGGRLSNVSVQGAADKRINVMRSRSPIFLTGVADVLIAIEFSRDSGFPNHRVADVLGEVDSLVAGTIDRFEALKKH